MGLLERKRSYDAADVSGTQRNAKRKADNLFLWTRCRRHECQCGAVPCPAAKLKRCDVCGMISSRTCTKGDCKSSLADIAAAEAAVAVLSVPVETAAADAAMGDAMDGAMVNASLGPV